MSSKPDENIKKLYKNLDKIQDSFNDSKRRKTVYTLYESLKQSGAYSNFKRDIHNTESYCKYNRHMCKELEFSVDKLFAEIYGTVHFSDILYNLQQLDWRYNERLDDKISTMIESEKSVDIHPLFNYYNNIKSKNIREHCSSKMLFWTILDGDIYFLMGKDRKYGEWTPFGGTCNDKNQRYKNCQILIEEGTIHSCLEKELYEETKGLLKTPPKDCKFMRYTIPYRLKKYHTALYFSYLNEDKNEVTRLVDNFDKRGDEYKQELQNKGINPDVYFEMSNIALIHIRDLESMIKNSLAHYRTSEFRGVFGDKTFINDSESFLHGLHEKGDTNGEKLDMFFIIGLIKYLSITYKQTYNNTRDIVDSLAEHIDKNTKCEYKF